MVVLEAPTTQTGQRDRRRHRRFTLGVPVRLHAEGALRATTIELTDVSFRGCRLGGFPALLAPENDTRIAFGFVLPGRRIALAKGRVVRQVDEAAGGGVGLAIERANVTFYEFLVTLAESEAELAA
ncbi:MAG TPA: PilZ domain-containing protein [Polyangia bacterium]|jgi:hypothetical protein|nr:PilZ domain-containing protein [Polyangia bacterium]